MHREKTLALEDSATRELAKKLALALLFAGLTALGSHIKIPIAPVPVTLQVFFVLLSGLALGPVWGPASQLVFIIMGLCGAPVFASAPYAGPTVLVGPTGGYLCGFVVASGVVGLLSEKLEKSFRARSVASFIACIAGVATIYLFGATWLGVWLRSQGQAATLAYKLGIKPFIMVDLVKGLAAAFVGSSPKTNRLWR